MIIGIIVVAFLIAIFIVVIIFGSNDSEYLQDVEDEAQMKAVREWQQKQDEKKARKQARKEAAKQRRMSK